MKWLRWSTGVGVAMTCAVGGVAVAPPAMAEDVRPQQWYLDAMQADNMWKVSTGKGITVAVIDSGVNPDTDALRGQVLPGKDVSGRPGNAHVDFDGHGTAMAEIIAGTGGNGSVRGLAPDANILPVRMNLTKPGEYTTTGTLDEAIEFAAASDAQIINMSVDIEGPYAELDDAVKVAEKRGKLLFAGAGNDAESKNDTAWPAGYPHVVGVASSGRTGKISKFSQYKTMPTLAAPGEEITGWCDNSFQEYCERQGTSASTAIASASAALIWSKHPDWTANQVLRVMMQTAGLESGKAPSQYVGYGMVRPRMVLLEGEGDPGDPDVNPMLEPSSLKPSPSPSPSEEPAGEAAERVVVADAGSDGSGVPVGVLVGGGGAAVLVAVAGAFLLRARRRAR